MAFLLKKKRGRGLFTSYYLRSLSHFIDRVRKKIMFQTLQNNLASSFDWPVGLVVKDPDC